MGYQSSSYACDRLSGITKTTSLLSCYTAATFFSMDSHFELESLSTVISEEKMDGKLQTLYISHLYPLLICI